MIVLLPPSETKRDGGDGPPLHLDSLSSPELGAVRAALVDELVDLAADRPAARRALGISASQDSEIDRNAALRSAPTMPAVERYTGVLYDALDAASLDASARAFAGEHLAIGSALFGLVGSLDEIPAYRLSYDSRVPGVVLKKLWREPVSAVVAARPGLLLDLRSEGYAALGPIPSRPDAVYLRVVSEGPDGRRQALNHFNKSGKGAFTRRLLEAGIDHADVDSLLSWARAHDIRLDRGMPGELELVV